MIEKLAHKYLRLSTLIIAALFLLSLLCIQVFGTEAHVTPVIISTVFQLVACLSFGLIWKRVAKGAEGSLSTLYLVTAGGRMFAAIVTVMAYCFLVEDKSMIKFFAIHFLVFYFIMLIFDTCYLVGVEKKIKQNV